MRRFARSLTGFCLTNIHRTSVETINAPEILELDPVEEAPEGINAEENPYEEISSIDQFARAKVLNFVKRYVSSTETSDTLFEVRRVHTFDGSWQYHAKIRLPVPDSYGERTGEGLASTQKDAEAVAAMHAERVIDALGLNLFQLSSKQAKHAAAARDAGRWAPMPGEEPRPPQTVSPRPLQLTGENEGTGVAFVDDDRRYSLVGPQAISPLRLTLASTKHLDIRSPARIRQYFNNVGCLMERYLRFVPLHAPDKVLKAPIKRENAAAPDGEVWLAQLKLPLDEQCGARVATGKAQTRRLAFIVCCMHAEMIVDAVGAELYPGDREKQFRHAEECKMANRWCVLPGERALRENVPSPPTAKILRYSA